ncbi:MAG: hypothetical protein FWG12_05340 [Holophagaceae bacterium]|nr:hypothetical protein [Holophagaceae bacterium]
MILRFFVLFSFSAALLCAQQKTIGLEIYPTGFPKEWSFQIELKLRYRAVDRQKIISEGRRSPNEMDILLEQISDNTHKWNISFGESDTAKIEGSPKYVTFNFPKPIAKLSNATDIVSLVGKISLLVDGKPTGNSLLHHANPFRQGETYVLLLQNVGKENAVPAVTFIPKDRLKDALEGTLPGMSFQGNPIPVAK